MLRHSSAADGSFAFLLHELSHMVSARMPTADGPDGPCGTAPAHSEPALCGEVLDMVIDRVTHSFESSYLVGLPNDLHDMCAPPHTRLRPAPPRPPTQRHGPHSALQ